jgi:hypothetical protein
MSAELLIANFLRIAAEDLEGARLLAAAHNRNAIYLCEQAGEKVIRAVVTASDRASLSIRNDFSLPRHLEPHQADHLGAEHSGVAGRD